MKTLTEESLALIRTLCLRSALPSMSESATAGLNIPLQPSCLNKTTVVISSTFYALTVLTFEAQPPNILQAPSSKPLYVHHVVLMPMHPNSITLHSSKPFSAHPSLVWISKGPLPSRCLLSVTSVNLLQIKDFAKEVKYRSWYGISGKLNFEIIKMEISPPLTEFRRIRTTSKTLKLKPFLYYSTDHEDDNKAIEQATKAWHHRLLKDIASICRLLEPIIID